MYFYQVGGLYHLGVRRWPECAQFNVRSGQAELVLFYNNPRFEEQMSVRKGDCQFGVVVKGEVIFFLYRFGKLIRWSDQPFSINLNPENERVIPTLESDRTRLFMQICLVDARTGILKVARQITLSPEMTRQLVEGMRMQMNTPFNASDYDRQIQQVYSIYPKTADLVKSCSVFSKNAG